MKAIISITSIPSRFINLPMILRDLSKQYIDEIWVNIPYVYSRFPDTKVVIPREIYDIDKVVVNRCDDYGPSTRYFAPIINKCDADIMICVDDDTQYPEGLTKHLIVSYLTDKCCWGLSGFKIQEYVDKSPIPREHNRHVDVVEGYGGILVELEWIRRIKDEFVELTGCTYNDDMIMSNLFSKYGITKKTYAHKDVWLGKIRQYQFGATEDALFYNNGEKTHYHNNVRIINEFKKLGKYYFNND